MPPDQIQTCGARKRKALAPQKPAKATRKDTTLRLIMQARSRLLTAAFAARRGKYTECDAALSAAACDVEGAQQCCKVTRQFEEEK